MQEAEIAKLIGVMAAAYPSVKLSEPTIEVYIAMLKDIPLDVLTASIQQCMAESEFLPTVAKVRDKALALTAPIAPVPIEAWGIVLKAIGKYGFYRTPEFNDPIITKAVECIGWKNLCCTEMDNQGVDRAHFSRVYEGLLRQAENDRRMLPQARLIQEQVRRMVTERAMPEVPKIESAAS
jgi:hypothetical protein